MNQSEIYQPAEDSFLLAECVKYFLESSKINKKEIKVLDMGSGSGIQSTNLINQDVSERNIVLVDINPDTISFLKKKFTNSKIILSNLFEKLNSEKNKFDLILFNPPYLPENKFDKGLDTTGGKNGSEVINNFLVQAKKYLSKNGKIIVLTSSLTKKINWQDYKKKCIGKKRIFFEILYVWELEV
ncbi:MAG TPA: methyltransferase domain-containing protein [Candidatus Pacearchaeota archaeon]|nr:methyltransferase domain-containing protein [Candidatus Pacearchaeota archaeon]